MHIIFLTYLCSFSLLLFISGACRMQQEVDHKITKSASTDQQELLFIQFKIKYDSVLARNVIELISKSTVQGKSKGKDFNNTVGANYLQIELLDGKKTSASFSIQHPLFKHVEFLDNTNTFTFEKIALKEADFFVRLRKSKTTTAIKIREISLGNAFPCSTIFNL